MTIKILRLNPFLDLSKTEEIWKEIEANATVSFFNSWSWVKSWLDTLPSEESIEMIVVSDDDGPACSFFLGITKNIQNKFYKKRGHLNSVGNYQLDDIVIEYNSIICKRSKDFQKYFDFALDSLADIEEFRLPLTSGLEDKVSHKFFKRIEKYPSYWIDLNKVEPEGSILNLISKNKRAQINRSLREYEKDGDVKVQFATNISEAKDYLKKLEELHQKEWIKRGKPGAFSNSYFKKFHETLIENCFSSGQVKLAKVVTPKQDIGYLYYFIHNNEALFYQSGLNYQENNKIRPGLVCHLLATNAFNKEGYSKYNFLAGTDQYKKSLATDFDELSSIVLARKNLKSNIENILRKLRGRA